jgi:hypothetical protein
MSQDDTYTTKPLLSWANSSLHYKAHERLGEALFYYLVRVRPLELEQVVERLNELSKKLKLGIMHVYPIFGQWDMVLRVWLHPSVVKAVESELHISLPGHHIFAVSRIVKRWYDNQDIEDHLLEELNETTLRAVQSGQDINLFRKLVTGKLIRVRDIFNETTISFFLSINLDSRNGALQAGIVDALSGYLVNSSIKNASIYTGYGFCRILFTGQVKVQDYFDIAKLPNSINKQFKSVGVETETFLLLGPPYTIGEEPIGEATFRGLRGINLFVHSFIPELYSDNFPQREVVESFISEEARNREFTSEDKKFIRKFLVAFLNEDVTQMQSTLFTYLVGLETYLRANHAKFIGKKTQRPLKETYQVANIEISKKHLPLGDLLRLCSMVIERLDTDNEHLVGDWDDLANLRNQVAHGDEEFERKWREHLKILFKQLPRVRQLKSLIANVIE